MAHAAAPQNIRFDQRTEPSPVIGVGNSTPSLSWSVPTADAGYTQQGYEVEVTRGSEAQNYRVESAEQILVPWPAPELASRESAIVRIRVTDGSQWSDWSVPSSVEAGLLSTSDWQANFVSPTTIGAIGERAPILSGTIDLPANVAKARLFATAHGIYVPSINGQRIDDSVLAPGWTSYDNRLRYQTYDVTDLLREGPNSLDMLLGNGWYRGRLGFENKSALYGDRLAVLAQLEVTLTDGTTRILVSDDSWTARDSNILADDLYDGQRTDLRDQQDTAQGSPVEVVPADLSILIAPEGPPIRTTEVLAARSVVISPKGKTLVDFGQNLVGWIRLRARNLPAGQEVTFKHAEVLENDELCTEPLRSAKATDTFIVSGASEEILEPSLTLHGFRYAEIDGIANLRAEDIEAVVVGSDLKRTGWFDSSDELLNRFHENVNWSIRGNFVDVPTDCPQRDERLGWTGDIQIFAPTASFLYDVSGFLSSWLSDLAVEQLPDGSVPHVIPDVIHADFTNAPTAAWGDAAVLIPWTMYERTGNTQILAQQYPSMRAWVEKVRSLLGPDLLWEGGFQYGDWLDPSAPPEDAARARTDQNVVATAHLARSARTLSATAALLGLDEDAQTYAKLGEDVAAAFARSYVTASGRVLSDSQTAYAMAIVWDLLPNEEQRQTAGRRLADLVRISGFRISTGFVGTPLVCDALTMVGELDVAYRLLLQTGCPSWLYPVTMGATTVWERWDSMRPDGTVNPGGMTSFNHYALGAVADWLHRSVAGLAPAEPGYRSITVEPHPSKDLDHASARHLTPYGEASVAWKRTDGKLTLDVTVPVGATARVFVPGSDESEVVQHGTHSWTVADPALSNAERENSTIRDLLDYQPQRWSAIVDAAVETGYTPEGEAQAADKLARYLGEPIEKIGVSLLPEPWVNRSIPLRDRVEEILKDIQA